MKRFWVLFIVMMLLVLVACGDNGNDTEINNGEDSSQFDEPKAEESTELSIQITTTTTELLTTFEHVHEFNYNEVRAVRDGLISDFSGGVVLVIYSTKPLYELSIITVNRAWIGNSEILMPVDFFDIGDIGSGERTKVHNFVGGGSFPRSGISFLDDDIRRYFVISRDEEGKWLLTEFPNRNSELPSWRWESQRYSFDDLQITPATRPPDINLRRELLANAGISEYGWQVAVDFLRDFETLFEPVWRVRGDSFYRFSIAHGRSILSYDHPEIYFDFGWTTDGFVEENRGFFDRDGNSLADMPWICVEHYANYFRLFDFDGTGIPDIFVHFSQMRETSYIGFYEIFRYFDGEYRLLEMSSIGADGGVHPWAHLGSWHSFFIDDLGRLIAYVGGELGDNVYNHVVFDGKKVRLYRIVEPRDGREDGWHSWSTHHWSIWERSHEGNRYEAVDGWLFHSPVIYSTDIGLTSLNSFDDLRDEMMAYLLYNRNNRKKN